MRIGIITCWQPDDNYGTQIQCFALQTYLRKLGYDAFLIRYHRFEDMCKSKITLKKLCKALNLYLLINWIIRKLFMWRQNDETKQHDRNAASFREKYLNMTKDYLTYQELIDNPPEADVYIVGSDQVWNINYEQENNLNAHFLNFGNSKTKRISYAASFGFDACSLTSNYVSKVKKLLEKFDGISVREKSGIEILKAMGIENGVQVCDPTILLSADDYRKFFFDEKKSLPLKKYVLVYELVTKSNLDIKEIKSWAAKQNLNVVYITGHGKKTKEERVFASIPEWVVLIENAEYVITNSFHGTVFSLLFHRQVLVYDLKGSAGSTNSRISTLEKLCGKKLFLKKGEDLSRGFQEKIDWTVFEKNKEELRKIGVDFLQMHLSLGEN